MVMWLVDTATVTTQGSPGSHDTANEEWGLQLAKTGDSDLATSGDFFMATDIYGVELRGFEPRAFSLRRRVRSLDRGSLRCMSCERTARAPLVPSPGGTGGHADRPLVGECGHRRSSPFEPLCVLWKPSFAHVELVSDRHVHDLRRRPNQSVPPRPADGIVTTSKEAEPRGVVGFEVILDAYSPPFDSGDESSIAVGVQQRHGASER